MRLPGSRSRNALAGLVAVLGALAGCSLTIEGEERGDERTIEPNELEVGDCYGPVPEDGDGSSGADGGGEELVAVVEVVSCDEPHSFEVYYSFDLTEEIYPGPDVVEERWIAGCLDRFEGFVGTPFDESVLEISAIFPTEETWEELDDREVLCSVTTVSGEPLTSSAAGSGL